MRKVAFYAGAGWPIWVGLALCVALPFWPRYDRWLFTPILVLSFVGAHYWARYYDRR